jgi:very-short-patch-repair endonuclease
VTNPDELRTTLAGASGLPGVAPLREVLDRSTFTLTESDLERRFLPLAGAAGLTLPQTGQFVNGFKVDFYWPELGLVVETDGLRYHSTPAQQARDRRRDHAHAVAGLTSLRFTPAQVRYQPRHVELTLARVARRLRTPDGR